MRYSNYAIKTVIYSKNIDHYTGFVLQEGF